MKLKYNRTGNPAEKEYKYIWDTMKQQYYIQLKLVLEKKITIANIKKPQSRKKTKVDPINRGNC